MDLREYLLELPEFDSHIMQTNIWVNPDNINDFQLLHPMYDKIPKNNFVCIGSLSYLSPKIDKYNCFCNIFGKTSFCKGTVKYKNYKSVYLISELYYLFAKGELDNEFYKFLECKLEEEIDFEKEATVDSFLRYDLPLLVSK